MQLTTISDEEWAQVEAAAVRFRDDIAATSDRAARVVEIFHQYNDVMKDPGKPYRYS